MRLIFQFHQELLSSAQQSNLYKSFNIEYILSALQILIKMKNSLKIEPLRNNVSNDHKSLDKKGQIRNQLEGQNGFVDFIHVEKLQNNLKFRQPNGNKFYEPQQIENKKHIVPTRQSRTSVLKVYEHNGIFQTKQAERLTFGPHNFPKDRALSKLNNPEEIVPITHKKVKSKSIVKLNQGERGKKSRVYEIIQRELRIKDQQLDSLRPDTINHQLEKYVKKKGLEYLQENHENIRRANTEGSSPKKLQVQNQKSERKQYQQKQGKPKHNSYLPETFPIINRKANSKKLTSSQKDKNLSQKQVKKLTKKEKKMMALNDQEEMLGKIVYDKVQDYFKLNQKKANYFSRVKSESKIDEALVKYLKVKMDRADLIFNGK